MAVVAAALLGAVGASYWPRRHDPLPESRALVIAAPAIPNAFVATRENPASATGPAPPGMVWIPGGDFSMGSTESSEGLCAVPGVTRDALPVHRVRVAAFWMDATEVTNAQFAAFVKATGYTTVAERKPGPGTCLVLRQRICWQVPLSLHRRPPRWRWTTTGNGGATSPAPTGATPMDRAADIAGKDNYPVIHIAYADALAYGRWAGKRLPTEAEWEFAARGGLTGKLYPWGDELTPEIMPRRTPGRADSRYGHGHGWIQGSGTGGQLRAQWLWSLRCRRQRLGVDFGLVSRRLLPTTGGHRRRRAQSARAAYLVGPG